jgi:antitoxin VapB
MGLSIKNERTEALVRKLATMKGISLVTAVTLAVEEKIAQEEADREGLSPSTSMSRYDRLMAYAKEFSTRVPNSVHSWEIDSLLYDENGLPK